MKDQLDPVECRTRARKLRADAANQIAADKREVLLKMAKEYDALADEMEKYEK